MADLAGFDWSGYVGGLQDDNVRALAIWLADQGLGVGEFMEIVDRAYATAPGHWQVRLESFVTLYGRP